MAKVFLSAGHGGKDPGAYANGLLEKDINLNILVACKEELERHGMKVEVSRLTDEDDPVSQEVIEANKSNAEIAVSFHTNAGGGDGSETFYYPSSKEGKRLATLCEKQVVAIGQNSRGIKSGENLRFVNGTKMVAVLCECAFVDNMKDKSMIDSIKKQKVFGVAYAKAILEYFGIQYKKQEANKESTRSSTTCSDLKNLSEPLVINMVSKIFMEDNRRNGILASVSMAQFILESDRGRSELAVKANNCFGMKAILSGNKWSGSVWSGAKFIKRTSEYVGGKQIFINADFRYYPDIESSVADHSAYLLNAMNGSQRRYEGIKGCTDHRKAVQILKDGGYATDPKYVEKLLSVIDKYNLKRFDVSFEDDKGVPYRVRNDIINLNIRKGPGVNYPTNGKAGKGYVTIVDVKEGPGSIRGWGKLKSGVGWISLDYVMKI